MTDKQIIIDELKNDVACKENIINHLAEYNIKLENKLQAKEQECEELKNKIEFMEEYIKTVENARNEFEKESKFLKEETQNSKKKMKS